MMHPDYTYRAHCVKVYDGDTVTLNIDLGFGVILSKQRIRLAGINAPELRGLSRLDGLESRDALRGIILDKDVIIKTQKDKKGKYGRWIADIYLPVWGLHVNAWMIREGYAVKY